MAASVTVTVDIPASESRATEVAWATRALSLASQALHSKNGTVTSGTMLTDGAKSLGTWSYTPQASS